MSESAIFWPVSRVAAVPDGTVVVVWLSQSLTSMSPAALGSAAACSLGSVVCSAGRSPQPSKQHIAMKTMLRFFMIATSVRARVGLEREVFLTVRRHVCARHRHRVAIPELVQLVDQAVG